LPPKPLALATNSLLKKGVKEMKKKLPLILMLSCFFCLTGCQSEVDKCVEAIVKIDPKDIAQEGKARIACLKAQAGKE
jgi:hypothetical protein